jgi:hypothetical protein
MDLAEGKYLLFADGDDWLAPDATETFVRAAEITGCDWWSPTFTGWPGSGRPGGPQSRPAVS